MDIENLTLGQLREIGEIAARLGDAPRAVVAPQPIAARLAGAVVVVRSHLSGVWCGRLVQAQGDGVVLVDARRAWQWTGAGSCSGLALRGPTGGKIAPPVSEVVIGEYVEICRCTDEAITQWAAVPEWSGRG